MASAPSLLTSDQKDTENDRLNAAIAEAMKDGEFPDLKAILCQFMRMSGGARGVAKMLRREYKAAKDGSMIRSMILQMILQGAKSVTAKESARDVSLISDEDIARETAALVAKVSSAGPYGAVDAKP